ncbi:MAG: hypothetical protein A4E20_01520 [Nitrospira sp. SG-bin2]|uniref:hypothetical protein n=1 Tax=Nitrospira cf. moscoviensis SBR1015 TaxID=96242 RepID=UPI000A0B8C9C|nr:hypothetical protein [Nitrospira cf. moscoviensis SBR1015]OQW34884.1 MAG: hypothetical protein A4E20_01520 [Nitrospira sp. SG-bin2]
MANGTIRAVSGLAVLVFLLCAWVLSRGRLWLFILALIVLPQQALAECTTHTILNPDGTTRLCTTCCTAGTCSTFCN